MRKIVPAVAGAAALLTLVAAAALASVAGGSGPPPPALAPSLPPVTSVTSTPFNADITVKAAPVETLTTTDEAAPVVTPEPVTDTPTAVNPEPVAPPVGVAPSAPGQIMPTEEQPAPVAPPTSEPIVELVTAWDGARCVKPESWYEYPPGRGAILMCPMSKRP